MNEAQAIRLQLFIGDPLMPVRAAYLSLHTIQADCRASQYVAAANAYRPPGLDVRSPRELLPRTQSLAHVILEFQRRTY
jgi:hypothetical protein